ncbi:MAG: autotransporter domain-containing protein [Brevundimonas sp.]
MTHHRSAGARRSARLNLGASAIALAAGMLGAAATATPAAAQCVENPPTVYVCSGQTDVSQINAGPSATVSTTPGFGVDTSANGNGVALLIAGPGLVSYQDLNSSLLVGGGVSLSTATEISLYATGDIVADAVDALRIQNIGGLQTSGVWTGAISNVAGDGVHVSATGVSGELFLQLGLVTASGDGVVAEYDGAAGAGLALTGAVWGQTGAGVSIVANNGTDVLLQMTDVTGGTNGVYVENYGAGVTEVTASGVLQGLAGDGLGVLGGAGGTGVSIVVNEASGAENGIIVYNQGSGETRVQAGGAVLGQDQRGIHVRTDALAGDIEVEAVDVFGGLTGVLVENMGAGRTFVSTTGAVAGGMAGIEATNAAAATDLLVLTNAVQGGVNGVDVFNDGIGETFIGTAGLVTGGEIGVLARNGAAATDLTVLATDVQGGTDGIRVENAGSGDTAVVSAGSASGLDGFGVGALAGVGAGDISVEVNNAFGGDAGVATSNDGAGATSVTVEGLVEGGFAGVASYSSAGQGVTVLNEGVIRNASGLSSDLAVIATGGAVGITNAGQIRGAVRLQAVESLFVNEGGWNSAGGESVFLGGADTVRNLAQGIILARTDAATADTTVWTGLEVFENHGGLSLRDGGTGDQLQMTGNATFFGGSALLVDIGGQGGSDRFVTTGTLDIQAGSGLAVNVVEPLVLNAQYRVATADGGLTGEFDFDDLFLTAFAGLRAGYTETEAYIEFAQLRPLADAGITPNQKAAAGGADSLAAGAPVRDALLMLPDDQAAVAAFDRLSGEIHPSIRGGVLEDSRLPRDAVLARLSDGAPDGAVWGRVWTQDGAARGDVNAARAERDGRGLAAGVDRPVGNLSVGVAAAWSDADLTVRRRDSSARIRTAQALAYAGGRFGPWGVRTGVGYAQSTVESERAVAFAGYADALAADYDASLFQAFVEVGRRSPVSGGHVEPFASLTGLWVETDAFAETGGSAALSVEARDEDLLMSTLGLRYETSRVGAFSVRGLVGWRHAWGDLDPAGVHAFDGGAAFTVLGASQSDDAAIANLAAGWRLAPDVWLDLALDTVVGADGSEHAITAGLKVVF